MGQSIVSRAGLNTTLLRLGRERRAIISQRAGPPQSAALAAMVRGLGLCGVLLLSCGHVGAQSIEQAAPDCAPDAIAKARDGAEHGEVAFIYLMARYYSTGKCIAGDGEKAVAYYWKAAKLNYPPAYYNLGIIAAGGEKDYKAAELMFFRGAQLGHRGSELHLGILLHMSFPPVRDNAKSYAWLSLTASRGEAISQEAKGILEDLERKITDDEKQRGEALAIRLREQFGNVPAFTF